jgi:hypothetical protein
MKHCWLTTWMLMSTTWMLMLTAVLPAACSTTPVPGVCCLGSDDCSRLGLSEDRPCFQGQACVDFHCVAATCSNVGCPVEAPVCDGDACRGCRRDTECPSGACGDDGACVAEADIVYLSPTGVDLGSCPRSSPCKSINFAATRTSASRSHVVMLQGTYDYKYEDQSVTSANSVTSNIFIHGGGSSLSTLVDGPFLKIGIGATLRDLEISGTILLYGTAPILVERVKVRGPNFSGIDVSAQVTMRDVEIQRVNTGIRIGGNARLTIEHGVIHDVTTAIRSSDSGSIVDLTNLLVFGTSDIAIDLSMSAGGTIRSSTIADSGTDTGSGPRAFRCPSDGITTLTIRSSIIWAPGTVARAPIDDTCTLVSTIAGPTAVPGATNVDPLFVNAAQRDYHLAPNSQARDVADTGPSTDFEGDARPRGARFDIGADEAP